MAFPIKKTLFKVFGQRRYLKILNTAFFVMYDTGMLKKNDIYKYHYFVKYLINKDDTVIDIGANLGYYSKIFAGLTKEGGRLIAIEPVKPFYSLLTWRLRKYHHCISYNYALGLENKSITMSIPKEHGYLRTGLSHVSEENETEQQYYTFDAKMVIGSELLQSLSRIDYIKCDIEGYEEYVLPELKEIIRTRKPIVQVETSGTHEDVVMKLMAELNYRIYFVDKNKLVKFSPGTAIPHGDLLFIPESKEQQILEKLKKINKY
jgi:FkbM family methyltransferase